MAQKSRDPWVELGDSNTNYLHAYVKERKNQNCIRFLIRDDGSVQQQQLAGQE